MADRIFCILLSNLGYFAITGCPSAAPPPPICPGPHFRLKSLGLQPLVFKAIAVLQVRQGKKLTINFQPFVMLNAGPARSVCTEMTPGFKCKGAKWPVLRATFLKLSLFSDRSL